MDHSPPEPVTGKITTEGNSLSVEVDSPTVLSWKTNASAAEMCVSENGAPEKRVSRGTHGLLTVPWIKTGRTYLFRLYATMEPRRLLDEVKVSKKATGKITASPNIPIEPGSKEVDSPTVLSWKTNASVAEVCVSEDGAPEKLISRGTHGSLTVPWIKTGRRYLFRLYAATESRQLLDEVKVSKKIIGKITASPNPISIEAGSKTELRWQITAPAIAEIRVSEGGAEEKLVCRGASGSLEISGLRPAITYLFRLYGGADRELLDEIEVRLTDIPWALLVARLKANQGGNHFARVAELIGDILPNLLHRGSFGDWFRLWESKGFHVTPVHFYEPIPDSRELSGELWQQPQNLPGVDMNEASQRRLLCEVFPTFKEEYQQIPLHSSGEENRFYLANGRFEGIDPLVAYCLVRHFKPRKIIEVGSGYSTLLLAEAARANGNTELHSIEPYPKEFLTRGVTGLASLLAKKVQEVDLSVFTDLNFGDCLFIDTSHVVRIGGDVNFLFLKVLPRLKRGVIVHVHDIFFPFDYPRDWVIGRRRFWTEQYLLQAFLAFNTEFEVLVSSGYLKARFPEELKSVFPTGDPWLGGSFWMRRKSPTQETAK